MNIEEELMLIDNMIPKGLNNLYHIRSRETIGEFGKIYQLNGIPLYSVRDVISASSDIINHEGDVVLTSNLINKVSLSNTSFYSIIGFEIFKDYLLYLLYKLNTYKDYVFIEPIFKDTTSYYPEYFLTFDDGYHSNDDVLRKIIKLKTNYENIDISKIYRIINNIISRIDFRYFKLTNIYTIRGLCPHILIEDLGEIFSLRYKDLLLEKRRIYEV